MKTLRAYQPQQMLLLAQDMREWLPADHLAYFVSEVVESLDLSAISKAGLVSLGYVALDGTKIKANAPRHKAMSYKRMRGEEERLSREIQALLEAGVALDEEEDRRFGKRRRSDEPPRELARREQRLRVIGEATAALEAEARAAAAPGATAEPAREAPGPAAAAPKDKAQRNFTDPQSRIMKNGEKAFLQGYNCQVLVDSKAQMVVACAVSNQAAEAPHLVAMLEQVTENCGETPQRIGADAGYCSEGNLGVIEERGIEAYIAVGKEKHNAAPPPVLRGRIPQGSSAKQRLERKLRTKAGRWWYAKRKGLAEPLLGQIKQVRRFLQFLLRGQGKASGEWSLICAGHNPLRMRRIKCAGGAAGRAIERQLGLNPA
jgi:hypothetical protein